MAHVQKRVGTEGGKPVTRWVCRWAIWEGGQRREQSRSFATRAEAVAHAARMEPLEARRIPQVARLTFSQHAEEWLAHVEARRKASTAAGYRSKITAALPFLGHMLLRQIGAQHIEAAVQKISAQGRSGRPLSDRSAHHHHSIIRTCLAAAVRWGRITDNPATIAEAPRVERRRVMMPTMEEVAALVAAAEDDPPMQAFILLAALTGMRRGEIGALRWSAIDFDGKWIAVRAVVEQAGKAETARVREGAKTAAGVRRIAMSEAAEQVLRRHRAHEARLALAAGVRLPPDAFLFHPPASFQQHWTPSALTAKAARVKDRAAVRKEVQPLHGLRHRFASSLMGKVADSLIASALGHSDPRITRALYQQAEEAGERAAAAAADAALGGLVRRPR